MGNGVAVLLLGCSEILYDSAVLLLGCSLLLGICCSEILGVDGEDKPADCAEKGKNVGFAGGKTSGETNAGDAAGDPESDVKADAY